jgi:hypothetical protein
MHLRCPKILQPKYKLFFSQHHMGSPNSYEMNFPMVIFVMHAGANLSPKYLLFLTN